MIYFDNAATGGKKPSNVLRAVGASLIQCANPGRSGHRLSVGCLKRVLQARQLLYSYFNGYAIERVVFTKNCTEALNIAIFSALAQGGHAVTTCMEHNSVLRPLFALKERGVEVDVVPLDENGNISSEAVMRAVRRDTKAVIVTSASNVTGAAPDLLAISKVLPENALFIVDGAQGAGHLPIDMKKMRIDALTLAGHKGLFALQGSGALLFSERFSPRPVLFGGTGSESFNLTMPEFYPDRLEAGTLNYPAILSLLEGMLYLTAHEKDISKRLLELTELLLDGLCRFSTVKTYSKPNPCGIVAFRLKRPSELLASDLSEKYGICVRGGLHCAPLMHEALSTKECGLVRVSLSPFNTRSEVEECLFALRELL